MNLCPALYKSLGGEWKKSAFQASYCSVPKFFLFALMHKDSCCGVLGISNWPTTRDYGSLGVTPASRLA